MREVVVGGQRSTLGVGGRTHNGGGGEGRGNFMAKPQQVTFLL